MDAPRRLAGQPGRGADAIAAPADWRSLPRLAAVLGDTLQGADDADLRRDLEQCATMAAGEQVRARAIGAADATVGDN